MAVGEINQLCRILSNNTEQLLQEWALSAIIEKSEPLRSIMLENGRLMFSMVIQYLCKEITMEYIKQLSEKVAYDRMKANGDVSDFVHNINLGRTVCLSHFQESTTPYRELYPAIQLVNECFNNFLYFSIQTFVNVKNLNMQEKESFIERTHKERLTILGQMSSSFVHEFRNPLTSIKGFLKLLQKRYPSIEYLDIMSHELEQLNFRISQFLLLSKREVYDEVEEAFALKDLIDETLEFLYPSIVDGEVDVKTKMESGLTIFACYKQIRQILINLIVNSIDALQSIQGARRLVIYTRKKGKHIELTIENNGPKIPEDLLKAIFEPFVTTKELGTGIGLYVCKQIMEKHNGSIHCQSNEKETTFTIQFLSHAE